MAPPMKKLRTITAHPPKAAKDTVSRKTKKPKAPKSWEKLLTTLASFTGEDAIIREEILAYAVSSTALTIPAWSSLTGMSHLQTARWEAIGQLQRPISLLYEAEKAFFRHNTIFVRSFDDMRPDITMRFLPSVQRLYVNMAADPTTQYRQRVVNALHGRISTALSDCPALEMLVLAVTYDHVKRRQREGKEVQALPELRVIVGALQKLEIKQKLVLMCDEDDHVEEREELEMGEVKEGRTVEWMLARSKTGVAFEV